MHRVLFVCTGNIFRSLTAEYALRHVLGVRSDITVASAGTEDFPHVVNPYVRDYLFTRGFDVTRHCRRTLTAQMLQEPGPVIAMSTEHRSVLAERFNLRDIPLFTEACGLAAEPLRRRNPWWPASRYRWSTPPMCGCRPLPRGLPAALPAARPLSGIRPRQRQPVDRASARRL